MKFIPVILAFMLITPAMAADVNIPSKVWEDKLQFVMAVGNSYGAKTHGLIIKDPTEGSSPVSQLFINEKCNFYVAVNNNSRMLNLIFSDTEIKDIPDLILALEAHELGHCLTHIKSHVDVLKETTAQRILDERAQDIFALVFIQQYNPNKFDIVTKFFNHIRNDPEFSYDTLHKSFNYNSVAPAIKTLAVNYTPYEISRFFVYGEALPKL